MCKCIPVIERQDWSLSREWSCVHSLTFLTTFIYISAVLTTYVSWPTPSSDLGAHPFNAIIVFQTILNYLNDINHNHPWAIHFVFNAIKIDWYFVFLFDIDRYPLIFLASEITFFERHLIVSGLFSGDFFYYLFF